MASSWEELNAQYGAPSASGAKDAGSDGWAALAAKYGLADNGSEAAVTKRDIAKPVEQSKEVSLLARIKAGMAGVNKGFYSDLAGLPVDTMQNVIDLGKAGFGTVASMAGRPDLAPNVSFDRSNVVGSSDWIAKQLNNAGMGGAINNPNPQDPASRIAYTGGRFAGASVVPNAKAAIGLGQQVRNAAMSAASGLAAGTVGEVAPDYAGVAGMMPGMAAKTGADAVRYLARGGETGRQTMLQRLLDLKNAEIDNPSAGLATGNRLVQGIENLLSLTPGSMGTIGKNRLASLAGLQSKAEGLRSDISPVYGATEAGTGIQADLKGGFKDRISNTYGMLNDRVEKAIGPDGSIPVTDSLAAINRLTTPIAGAQNTSSNFINGRLAKIGQDLSTDAGAGGTVPYSAVRNLRTRVGQEASSSEIIGTPQQGEYKQLYGALSQDIKNGVAAADLLNGTKGSEALNRANAYYANAMRRAEAMDNLAKRNAPEGAYNALAQSLGAGETTYSRVRNAVSPETRQKVAAPIVDDLGRATPGQQNAEGSVWSPQTFVTNYNKIDPQARAALFKRLPGGSQYASDLDTIAKAADMVNQGAKVMANPSGTAAALANRGTISALTVGAYFYPFAAATTAGGLAMGNATARLLTSPTFVRWLADAPKIKPEGAAVHMQRILQAARASKDAQFQNDVDAYLQSMQQITQGVH